MSKRGDRGGRNLNALHFQLGTLGTLIDRIRYLSRIHIASESEGPSSMQNDRRFAIKV
jgi:hypothetical protein